MSALILGGSWLFLIEAKLAVLFFFLSASAVPLRFISVCEPWLVLSYFVVGLWLGPTMILLELAVKWIETADLLESKTFFWSFIFMFANYPLDNLSKIKYPV